MAETEARNQPDSATHPVNITITRDESAITDDPFANQRSADNDPFTGRGGGDTPGNLEPSSGTPGTSPKRDRRLSKEWDASKVPPSRFQKPEGSIYATPSSRDRDGSKTVSTAFAQKLKEKGWL